MRRVLSALVLVVLACPPAAAQTSGRAARVESRVLGLINQGRARQGLPPMRAHAGLARQARAHSRSMAAAGRLGHAGFAERVARAGLRRPGVAACENVAAYRPARDRGEEDVAQTINRLWVNSARHRRCMYDGRVRLAGVGVYRDGAGKWWATLEAVSGG